MTERTTTGGGLAGHEQPKVEIYDTTLRDGSQQVGLDLTVADKLRVASVLDGPEPVSLEVPHGDVPLEPDAALIPLVGVAITEVAHHGRQTTG